MSDYYEDYGDDWYYSDYSSALHGDDSALHSGDSAFHSGDSAFNALSDKFCSTCSMELTDDWKSNENHQIWCKGRNDCMKGKGKGRGRGKNKGKAKGKGKEKVKGKGKVKESNLVLTEGEGSLY